LDSISSQSFFSSFSLLQIITKWLSF